MKPKQLAFTVLIAMVAASLVFFAAKRRNEFPSDKVALTLRWIGDQILRKAGDSTSRVLPVREIGTKVFQLEFQSEFRFVPDTLVRIVHSTLRAQNLPLGYSVNVRECATDQVIYGYRIGADRTTLVPCLGREQPNGCYVIQIAFEGEGTEAFANTALSIAVGLAFVGAVAFIVFGKTKGKSDAEHELELSFSSIGNSLFSEEHRILKTGKNSVSLTDKEARLLGVLAAHPNVPLDRDQLMKEVWEDDGVIVSRSLDVFVSKLRKKLSHNPTIRIVNIHGKGYRLEVD